MPVLLWILLRQQKAWCRVFWRSFQKYLITYWTDRSNPGLRMWNLFSSVTPLFSFSQVKNYWACVGSSSSSGRMRIPIFAKSSLIVLRAFSMNARISSKLMLKMGSIFRTSLSDLCIYSLLSYHNRKNNTREKATFFLYPCKFYTNNIFMSHLLAEMNKDY